MQTILNLLKQVAATPSSVVVDPSSPMAAFPGQVEFNFDLRLENGFQVGHWMDDESVSVAEELQQLDISPPTSPNKRVLAVWRIALVDGPVVLMNIEISGVEDCDFNEPHLVGYATVVDDPEVAPFVAELMMQLSRSTAFDQAKKILEEAARLRKQFEAVFPDGLQRAEALQQLAQA